MARVIETESKAINISGAESGIVIVENILTAIKALSNKFTTTILNKDTSNDTCEAWIEHSDSPNYFFRLHCLKNSTGQYLATGVWHKNAFGSRNGLYECSGISSSTGIVLKYNTASVITPGLLISYTKVGSLFKLLRFDKIPPDGPLSPFPTFAGWGIFSFVDRFNGTSKPGSLTLVGSQKVVYANVINGTSEDNHGIAWNPIGGSIVPKRGLSMACPVMFASESGDLFGYMAAEDFLYQVFVGGHLAGSTASANTYENDAVVTINGHTFKQLFMNYYVMTSP